MDLKRRLYLARLTAGSLGFVFLDGKCAESPDNRNATDSPHLCAPLATDLDAKSFGAIGDGKTDDTAALQQWIAFLVKNRKRGRLSAGDYRISGPLKVPSGNEWAIDGDLAGGTRIVQLADNVPILDIGTTGNRPLIHTWRIADIEFDYLNDQPASNEQANPIVFSQMACEFSLTRLRFARGSYAIKVRAGIGGPWGGSWDDLVFESGLTAGAMDWAGCLNGVPNNKWGRFFVDCKNMSGPVFKEVRGYNWIVDTIEFIAAQRGAQLLSIAAGSMVTFGALKLENGVYRSATDLIRIATQAHVQIGQFFIGGNEMVLHPETGALTLFAAASGGPTGSFDLNTLVASATELGGSVFVLNGAKGPLRIRNMTLDRHAWQVCDNVTSSTGDTLTLDQYKNDRVSNDIGDRSYTVALGSPNILSFESAFSEPRTLDLPTATNDMFNGLYYEIRLYGAVSEKNALTIRCDGVTKLVAKTDKVALRFVWRRAPAPAAAWILTSYEPLP
jgi:hypothetical protein